MFTEEELKLIRSDIVSLGYVRELSEAEDKLLDKLNKLICEVHFNGNRRWKEVL